MDLPDIFSLSKIEIKMEDFEIDLDVESVVYENDIYNQTLEVSKGVLESKILKELEMESVKLDNLEIDMDISQDGSIVINKTKYSYSGSLDEGQIERIVYKVTGCDNLERY